MGDKANEELAKLGQKSLETAEKAGGWIDDVFGNGIRHVAGAFEDSMAGFRMRNRAQVMEKTRKAIEKSGMVGNVRALDPRISIPLFDAISNESDDVLQRVWADYIRNAVDPKLPNPERVVIDVVRRLEPADWPVLRVAFAHKTGELTAANFDMEESALQASLDRLHVLGLFEHNDGGLIFLLGGESDLSRKPLSITVDRSEYSATRLLRKLAVATSQWSDEHVS
ncbi:hypothetical protein M2360_003372 [Rhizobium sp. SG_E_25_P2]|uniref:hypothetical protein n=1 Tax=Rhizobium sp. SG_E_25_P2 TaxID=2879942 RepID=UPI0024740CB6|nr:hypothetical protein [Rhizobium sp. SG_E_25_P2]MDH6267969.1 hypothetical protein [Rhizobium sp. SG_E_25_P2]